MTPPQISVLIPALNEERNIGRCIESIRKYLPPNISSELLVGDHGSTDNTAEIAASSGAKLFKHSGGTVGDLRNFLATKSMGPILVFLDADVSVTEEWGNGLPAVLSDLSQQKNQITGSFCSVPNVINPFITYWFAEIPQGESTYLGTGHMILPRELFDQLNGFDVRLISGEDFDLCRRAVCAGASLVIRPHLTAIHHDYPLTIMDFLKRERWHGTGDFQSVAAILKSKVALLTLAFLGLIVAFLLLALLQSMAFIIPLILIVALVTTASFTKFKTFSMRGRIYNMAIFFLYFLGRSWSIREALRYPRRPARF